MPIVCCPCCGRGLMTMDRSGPFCGGCGYTDPTEAKETPNVSDDNMSLEPPRVIQTAHLTIDDEERIVWLCLEGAGDGEDWDDYDHFRAWWALAEDGQAVDEPASCYVGTHWGGGPDAMLAGLTAAYADINETISDRAAAADEDRYYR